MSRKFAVLDIDGTVIRWQLYHAIVDELAKQGHLAASAHDRIAEARLTWKSRSHSTSFDDYETTLVHVYHEALTDLKVSDYLVAVDTVFERYKDQVYTYTRDLIRELKQQGYFLLIISGSQQEVIEKLGTYYGFDAVAGAEYVRQDGHFTGERTTTYGRKDTVLKQLVAKHDLSYKDSIAVGDTSSDIAMLELVERPIAFNPNRSLYEHAKQQGWKIVVERKNVIYELEQGDGHYQLAEAD